jgi:excinuclease ABC subunit A
MNLVLVYTKETTINFTLLEQLRDIGNSVIVVEHDKDMIERADYVIDIGPKAAGKFGGEIISIGTPAETLKSNTITAQYLNGEMKIEVPSKDARATENS